MGKPTFPDQQQDLQNAAAFSVASECDGSVTFGKLAVEAYSGRFGCPDGVWVGWGVSQVQAAFVTTLAVPSSLRLWDGSGLIYPVTHRCLASSSFRARSRVYSQADFFVGAGNAISFPRSTPALCHSHPHWQRTESHNRGFLRSALHTAHDLIHMVLLHRESDRDLDSLIATGLSIDDLYYIQLLISKRDSVSPPLDPTTRKPSNLCAAESSALASRKSPY